MQILLDMDNVVADLLSKWLEVYNTTYDDNVSNDQITSWQIDLHINKCSSQQFYAIIEQPGFFAELEVIQDSIEVTKRLQDIGHQLYFVTATPYGCPTGGYDKYVWIDKYFPHIGKEKVIQAHHKHMIKGDLLFDDGPKNLQDFHGIKVAMDFPYNKSIAVNYRVKTWLEFEKIIQQLTHMRKTFGNLK